MRVALSLAKWVLACAVLLFIAWRIWPTPYEYRYVETSGNILRIERATGKVWITRTSSNEGFGWLLVVPAKGLD